MIIIQKHLAAYGNIVKIKWAVDNNGNIAEVNGTNATDSFNFKAKLTGQTRNNGIINDVEIMVPLKYLSSFRMTL